MGIGGFQNEGEANDLLAQKCERGHAVAGFPEILDQRELAEGIVADHGFVKCQISFRGIQIARGEIAIGRAQISQQVHVAAAHAVGGEVGGDQVDLFHRLFAAPEIRALLGVALAHGRPLLRGTAEFDTHVEAHQPGLEVGHPHAAVINVDAARVDDAGGGGKALGVFSAELTRVGVDGAGVAQADLRAAVGDCQAIGIAGCDLAPGVCGAGAWGGRQRFNREIAPLQGVQTQRLIEPEFISAGTAFGGWQCKRVRHRDAAGCGVQSHFQRMMQSGLLRVCSAAEQKAQQQGKDVGAARHVHLRVSGSGWGCGNHQCLQERTRGHKG